MKKILLILLVCSLGLNLQAQDSTQDKMKIKSDDSKTKIKDDKGKIKDEDGKMKIKNETDLSDNDGKTKIKDDKVKMKDEAGKVKVKGEGNMNSNNSGSMTNSGMGSSTTTTNINVTTTWEAFPPKPATLPVVGSNVPADVVSTLKNKYGTTLYDIKQIKSSSGQLIYVIRLMENGGMRSEYVGADGNVVTQ